MNEVYVYSMINAALSECSRLKSSIASIVAGADFIEAINLIEDYLYQAKADFGRMEDSDE